MKKLDEEVFQEYKKLGRGNWGGKDLIMWKALYNGFLTIAKDEEFTPITKFMLNIFLDVRKARKEEIPIIMHPFNYAPELFHAMDLSPFMQETFSVGLAPLHLNEGYIDYTNTIGYGDNPTLCNAQRPLIGAYLQGAAPVPDLLFYLSTPCNSLAMTYQVYSYLSKVPTYNLDIPYWNYDQTSEFYDERTLGYVDQQLKSLIAWIENKTNRKFNPEKFQQTMTNLNKAREYILEFNELLKAKPCPMPSIAGFGNWLAMVTKGGTSEGVEVTKYNRDMAAENVKQGIGGIEDEKLRIAWPYTHIFFDRDLLTWIEENLQAVVIMDLLGYYPVFPHDVSTVDKCYESLVKGTLDFSMVGTCRGMAELYVDFLLNYVKEYSIDAVIIPIQFACKHAYSITRIAAEAVRQELDIPTLVFGCDPYDSREVTSETIRERISEFITQVVL